MNTPSQVQERFRHFVVAREELRANKEVFGGPPPWSRDPVLNSFRFCNINREDDTVTRWIDRRVRSVYHARGINFIVPMLSLCRFFNEPLTLTHLVDLPDHAAMRARLVELRPHQRLFRGAYMTAAHGDFGKGMPADEYWMLAVETIARIDFSHATMLTQVAAPLMKVRGVAEFLANQICTDLRYVPGYSWKDWGTFIQAGPGTRRGVSRYMTGELTMAERVHPWAIHLLRIRDELRGQLPPVFDEYYRDPNNLSNSFCEFDKYERAATSTSTLRKYGNQIS